MRRLLIVVAVALLGVLSVASPASAEGQQGNDPANDVPYDRGDLIFYRAIHGGSKVDLRVRTAVGGNPENVWPNRRTYIRWNIDTDFGQPGPEYWADIRIETGEDTVMLGKVRRVSDNSLQCSAQNHVMGNNLVSQAGNQYRFQFLRGCIGAPNEFRARATMVWDNANPGGPVNTDYAPNGGPTQPLSFF